MEREMKKRIWRVAGVIMLILLALIGGMYLLETGKETPDLQGFWQNTILSITCSLIASAGFYVIQGLFDYVDHLSTQRKLDKVDENLKTVLNLYDSGIVSIRPKSYYDRDDSFWKTILYLTNDHLDLIGHSISNWFQEEYKETFEKKIREMITAGKRVRIVLSGETYNESKIKNVESEKAQFSQLSKIDKTYYYLRQLWKELPENSRNLLEVYTASRERVTYLYIRTDTQCFVSPYILGKESGNSFLLEIKAGEKYADSYKKDFEEITGTLNPISWECGNDNKTKN